MEILRTAYVYVKNVYAGELCETDDGYLFSYDSDYIESNGASVVSLTMPLSKQTYTSKTLFPFFDGLIPEGWLLQVVSRSYWRSEKIIITSVLRKDESKTYDGQLSNRIYSETTG